MLGDHKKVGEIRALLNAAMSEANKEFKAIDNLDKGKAKSAVGEVPTAHDKQEHRTAEADKQFNEAKTRFAEKLKEIAEGVMSLERK